MYDDEDALPNLTRSHDHRRHRLDCKPDSTFHPEWPLTKNSIAGNRTRGTNVKGLYVTNYTTMDI